MPALYTHYKFGQDVLNKLNKKLNNQIKENIDYYNMFNQAFDNLYYHFKWSYYKNFGVKAHTQNIDSFFYYLLKYIKDNNLDTNSMVTNVIYGFINHYTIDTIIHPFINYQVKNLGIPHTKIEFMLDYYLFTEENDNWKNRFYKILIPKLKFNSELKNTLDYTFLNSHNEKNIGKIFNQSHNNGYYIYRYFINDMHGIKTFFYKIIDFLLKTKNFKFSKNTFTKEIDLRILNNDKLLWHHPSNKNETYNYSFKELYNYSYKIAIKLCKEANKVLNDKQTIENFVDSINKINIKNIQEFPLK